VWVFEAEEQKIVKVTIDEVLLPVYHIGLRYRVRFDNGAMDQFEPSALFSTREALCEHYRKIFEEISPSAPTAKE
jgi:hypothetical protein